MNFNQAFEYLNNFSNYEKKAHLLKPVFSLEAITRLLAKIGSPHKKLPTVHVAGTVGKGSVCHMTERVLREAGYKTALYTSPHFIDVRERIKVDGKMISKKDFTAATARLRDIIGDNFGELTYFEMLTALAFDYFARCKVDVAIIEVGLGGRLDATNVVEPYISVITRLGWDHVNVLGPKLSDIAGEKAGIIKKGCIAVSAPQHRSAAGVLENKCRELKVPLHVADPQRQVKHLGSGRAGELFEIVFPPYNPFTVELPLQGGFQVTNLSIALTALVQLVQKGFDFSDRAIKKGLEKVNFEGRMEMVNRPAGAPLLMLDGAHNPTAAEALARALPGRAGNVSKIIFVASMMRDKDSVGILKALAPASDTIVLCTLPYDRSVTAREIEKPAKKLFNNVQLADNMKAALEIAEELAPPESMICVTGSLYAVAEAKLLLK